MPSGGFVASSGLESYTQHGLLQLPTQPSSSVPEDESEGSSSGGDERVQALVRFISFSLHTTAHTALPIVSDAHAVCLPLAAPSPDSLDGEDEEERLGAEKDIQRRVDELCKLDTLAHATTLNDAARRASCAQGAAYVALYTRAFAPSLQGAATKGQGRATLTSEQAAVAKERGRASVRLAEGFRACMRAKEAHGHLAIGFGLLSGLLALSTARAQRLFLFLHARALVSSAVRLNILGPYMAHRILLHDVRILVDDALDLGRDRSARKIALLDGEDDDGPDGIANTWPLGEIVAARHDQLHSKIFNS